MNSLCIYDDEDIEILTIDEVNLQIPLFYLTSIWFTSLGLTSCKWLYDEIRGDGYWFPNISNNRFNIKNSEQESDLDLLGSLVITTDDNKKVVMPIDYSGFDKPYKLPLRLSNKEDSPGDLTYIAPEWMSLFLAVSSWLKPERNPNKPSVYLKPSERFLNNTIQLPNNRDILSMLLEKTNNFVIKKDSEELVGLWQQTYLDGVFRYRTSSVGSEIFVTEDEQGNKQLVHLYKSNSILSLAWMEIMWAIENNIYAQFCDNCGGIYRIKPPYTRSSYICSEYCAKEHRIEKMGGIDKLREYNRMAQRRSRGQKNRI